MNKVIIIGRLTADPEVRYSQQNLCVAKYTLAVDRVCKKGEEKKADFILCVAMGSNGEFAEKYLKKGMKIAVEGRWQTGSYTSKSGQKVYTNECFVERQEFGESRTAQGRTAAQPATVQQPTTTDEWMSVPDNLDDDSLPFD